MASAAPVHLSFNTSIDVSGTVSKLLAVETAKITKVQDKQTVLQTDVTAWSDVSSSLTSLSDSLNKLRDWQTWNTMKVTSSNTAQFTATASSSATDSTYSITIDHIALAHSVASRKASDLGLSGTTDTLVGKVSGLNTGDQFQIGGASGQTITIAATDTIATLCGKINTASSSLPAADQVTASIMDNRLILTRTSTGSTALNIANVSGAGTPLDKLGIMTGAAFNTVLAAPQDALFSVNGLSITRSSNTNLTDVLSGVTLNLHQSTAKADGSIGVEQLTVAHDTDVVSTAINTFITDYNAVTTKLGNYTKVDLTDPKAPKTAELQADEMAAPILAKLRKLVGQDKQPYMNSTNASYDYNGQTGIMSSLASIGIGTSGEANNISITDSTRLASVLTNNFAQAEQLMRGVPSNAGYQHGVADELYNYTTQLSTSMTGDIAKHVSVIQNQSTALGTQIDTMTTNLSTYEQSLWTQFDAMDQAMSNMTTQLSYISNTIGK